MCCLHSQGERHFHVDDEQVVAPVGSARATAKRERTGRVIEGNNSGGRNDGSRANNAGGAGSLPGNHSTKAVGLDAR
eukprot:3052002-Rhodomonas_salina.1